ncbi:hypothetical protein D3C75_627400 [compost metagenome]
MLGQDFNIELYQNKLLLGLINVSSSVGKWRNISMSYLYCPECENMSNIQRKNRKLKSNGHIKDLWCHRCKKITKHIEKREDLVNQELYLDKIWASEN